MKRSEMIDLIRAVIVLDDGSNGLAPIDRPELPEYILNIIEKAGMLPPLSKISRMQLDKAISKSEHVNGILYDADNVLTYLEWEDECEN